jgi:hypothetical protein
MMWEGTHWARIIASRKSYKHPHASDQSGNANTMPYSHYPIPIRMLCIQTFDDAKWREKNATLKPTPFPGEPVQHPGHVDLR